MTTIVEQFRALQDVGAISNTYWYADQKHASKMFEECVNNNSDDEILLEGLRSYAFTFVNALQAIPADELSEWRAFLRKLIKDVISEAAFTYSENGFPDWRDQSRRLIALSRLGVKPDFAELRRLIMDGRDRLPNVASFASDCKNIVAIGKALPNITRDIVAKSGVVENVVIWLNLVEIYTRLYQGRKLYKHSQYAKLVEHLSNYKCASKDQLQTWNNKTAGESSAAYDHVLYFLNRVKHADLHLAATFLCDNITTIAQLRYPNVKYELSMKFNHAVKLAALSLKEEMEMNEQKPRKIGDLMHKRFKHDDIGRQIDELNENIRQLNAEWEQMREAAAKLRATIAKSKKLIADWEC